ncbi:levanase/fructan beta-fructosidase [Isoptericola jiangsuensis]|uniref:Levanase/fructan beta-fructosidase n=1 Tax=Isoptericola jiangsuensis TaxID=548579 RepID=A0A2A9EV73_9MICO|nr:glycoside hydrolase family 32 protein [Isoptericola jiangsuensis]PFG43047.1 levanase/fructan beta-fructosidase [Isoptericola jiangsuensis]
MTTTENAAPVETYTAADHLRPVAHFTARDTWLNDPNGLLFHDGTWHLFFQNNPFGSGWGNISWGHATSQDLVTWDHQPVAIAATPTEQVFSGSAVVDEANTSGFGAAGQTPLVAIYTSAYTGEHPRAGIQAQSLAYSLDAGTTWERYAHNPVLDIGSTEFRDPKVFRYGGEAGHWVMVVVEATDHRVAIYTSSDLIDWTFASHFGPWGATGGVWECPDLFELPVRGTDVRRWVMVVSLNPGGPAGGSGTQYFVGDFDGYEFVPDDDKATTDGPDWLDHGRDYYAAVSFSGVPGGRRVMLGWASNWDYAGDTPTAPWRSTMSLAREVDLVRWPDGRPRVAQRPVLPADPRPGLVVHDLVVPTTPGRHTEIELSTHDGDDVVRVTVDGDRRTITCDRTASGSVDFHETFASVDTVHLPDEPQTHLQIVLDGCVLELYAADGRATVTQLVFPRASLTEIAVRQADPEPTVA